MNSYDLLKPFKYSKSQIAVAVIFLALAILGLPFVIFVYVTRESWVVISSLITFFVLGSIVENKVLWATEIIGKITFDKNAIHAVGKDILFDDIVQMKLKKYFSGGRSWVARWKTSNKLTINLNNGTEHVFFISRVKDPMVKDMFELMEEIKKASREHSNKVTVSENAW